MDTTLLETACRASGMLPSALEDGLRRLHEHFAAQAAPTPALIGQQLTRLREHHHYRRCWDCLPCILAHSFSL